MSTTKYINEFREGGTSNKEDTQPRKRLQDSYFLGGPKLFHTVVKKFILLVSFYVACFLANFAFYNGNYSVGQRCWSAGLLLLLFGLSVIVIRQAGFLEAGL